MCVLGGPGSGKTTHCKAIAARPTQCLLEHAPPALSSLARIFRVFFPCSLTRARLLLECVWGVPFSARLVHAKGPLSASRHGVFVPPQAERGCTHIHLGHKIRERIARGAPNADYLREVVAAGHLVDDVQVFEMLRDALQEETARPAPPRA